MVSRRTAGRSGPESRRILVAGRTRSHRAACRCMTKARRYRRWPARRKSLETENEQLKHFYVTLQ